MDTLPTAVAAPGTGSPGARCDPRRLIPRGLIAVVAGGGLLWSSFPPTDWWPAAFAGLALLGWVLAHRNTTVLGGLGFGFVFGVAFYLPLLPWTGALVGMVPWLALSTLCAAFTAMFGAAAVALRDQPGWPMWWATWWVAVELLKSAVPFGGFPWGVLAFGQSSGPLAQLAPWGGPSLISFTTTLIGFTVTAVLVGPGPHRRRSAVVALSTALCLAALTGLAWEPWRSDREKQTLVVAAVQGNVPRLGLDFNAQRRAVLDNHVQQTLRLADDVRASSAPQPDLLVWPENSSDIDPLINNDAAQQIDTAARAINAPILIGAVLSNPPQSTDPRSTSNTMILWSPEDGPGARHDKKILQPFGEYLPWRGFFRLFSDYAERAGFFVPGAGSGVVEAADVSVGVATCWEAVFDRAPRESVRNGAQVLVIPTNNATFNETMSRQFLAFAKIRAFEHRRPVVVAGTTGVSAIITPDGRVVDETAFFTADYLISRIELNDELTPATRWTPIIHGVVTALAIAALLLAAIQRYTPSWRKSSSG